MNRRRLVGPWIDNWSRFLMVYFHFYIYLSYYLYIYSYVESAHLWLYIITTEIIDAYIVFDIRFYIVEKMDEDPLFPTTITLEEMNWFSSTLIWSMQFLTVFKPVQFFLLDKFSIFSFQSFGKEDFWEKKFDRRYLRNKFTDFCQTSLNRRGFLITRSSLDLNFIGLIVFE